MKRIAPHPHISGAWTILGLPYFPVFASEGSAQDALHKLETPKRTRFRRRGKILIRNQRKD